MAGEVTTPLLRCGDVDEITEFYGRRRRAVRGVRRGDARGARKAAGDRDSADDRPRARKNMGGVTGFSVADPGGNGIRIIAPSPSPPATTKLGRALENAVVQGDSRGDVAQAVKILSAALVRERSEASPADVAAAKDYLAELRERSS
jgi:hypothetical protein